VLTKAGGIHKEKGKGGWKRSDKPGGGTARQKHRRVEGPTGEVENLQRTNSGAKRRHDKRDVMVSFAGEKREDLTQKNIWVGV